MHSHVECKIFRSRQCHTRCGDTLNRRVVGKVHKHNRSVNRAGSSEVGSEEIRFFVRNTDCRKYNGEVSGIVTDYLCLTRNLRC